MGLVRKLKNVGYIALGFVLATVIRNCNEANAATYQHYDPKAVVVAVNPDYDGDNLREHYTISTSPLEQMADRR